MTTLASVSAAEAVTGYRPATTVLLHLAPGAVVLLTYVGLVPLMAALGLPSVAALAVAGLLAVPAVQLGVMGAHRRRWPGEPAVALRARLPLPRMLVWAGLEIVAAGAAFAVTAPVTRLLQTRVLAWWPPAWSIRLGTGGQYDDRALLITAGLLLFGTVLVAPMVEERYFRGFLLPRMPQRLGPWRVPAHVALFAGYHLWSLWLIPTRILAILPLAYIADRTRDVRVGMAAHVVLNATDLVVLLLFIGTH